MSIQDFGCCRSPVRSFKALLKLLIQNFPAQKHLNRACHLRITKSESSLKRADVSTSFRSTETSGSSFNRRALLKSAGMAAGAAMIDSNMRAAANSGARSGSGAQPTGEKSMNDDRGQRSLRKGLIGFQLAYEQFPVNELVELGVLIEQAGFDVITNS